jgi:hypothetical protein
MKPHSFHLKQGPACKHELTVSKVMLVYEDTDTGVRAKLALKHLPQELSLADGCTITLWRQDLLSLPWLREQAALDAGDADLILISIGGNDDTPGEIKDWLSRWLQHRGSDPCALGILTAKNSSHTENPIMSYVRCVADFANAIFFCRIEPVSRVTLECNPASHKRVNSPASSKEMAVPISR